MTRMRTRSDAYAVFVYAYAVWNYGIVLTVGDFVKICAVPATTRSR